MTHIELRGLIPAYALDALSPKEAREVEAHLPTCEECRRELLLIREVANSLAEGVPRVDPPVELRERILQAIRPRGRAETIPPDRAETIPRGRVLTFPPAWGAIFPGGWPLGIAALAAALAVVLAGIAFSLNQRLAALNERLIAQERVLALLANADSRTATLSGSVQANVRFVYHHATKQGVLVVTDLQDPGVEMVYQLWLIAGQEPESAGVFRPVPGRPIIVHVTADFSRYQAVAISVERGPRGAPRPTAAPILVGTI